MSATGSKQTAPIEPSSWFAWLEREEMPWYELPLLFCFMFHFFPPMAAGLYNTALFLAFVGILGKLKKSGLASAGKGVLPLCFAWLALALMMGISIFQVPLLLRPESWHRYISDFGKGTFLALLLLLHLDTANNARRLLMAGAMAALWMLIHCIFDATRTFLLIGELPRQRDYLYWMTMFFPFSLAIYVLPSAWRIGAGLSVVGILGLSVLSGFRGAMLSLIVMLLLFFRFARLWRPIAAASMLIVLGLVVLWAVFPEHAAHTLYKLQQTDSNGRWTNHWLPAWELTKESPWLGHGFGHQIFGRAVNEGLVEHLEWLPKGLQMDWYPSSPHSIVFELMFSAGWLSVGLYLLISAAICLSLFRLVWRARIQELLTQPWLMLSAVTLIVYVGNFVVFYQFEAPSWRSMPVIVVLAAACLRAFEKSEKGLA